MIATSQFTISVINDGATGATGPQGVSVTKVVEDYQIQVQNLLVLVLVTHGLKQSQISHLGNIYGFVSVPIYQTILHHMVLRTVTLLYLDWYIM